MRADHHRLVVLADHHRLVVMERRLPVRLPSRMALPPPRPSLLDSPVLRFHHRVIPPRVQPRVARWVSPRWVMA